jgi:hypothetical protein
MIQLFFKDNRGTSHELKLQILNMCSKNIIQGIQVAQFKTDLFFLN